MKYASRESSSLRHSFDRLMLLTHKMRTRPTTALVLPAAACAPAFGWRSALRRGLPGANIPLPRPPATVEAIHGGNIISVQVFSTIVIQSGIWMDGKSYAGTLTGTKKCWNKTHSPQHTCVSKTMGASIQHCIDLHSLED